MISNNFLDEMTKLGYSVHIDVDEKIKIIKDNQEIILSFEKIRRIFLNALVSHIDNAKDV
jgi:hypothetical protein